MQMDACIAKRAAPIDHCRVVMRMRDGNRLNTAQRLNLQFRLLIEQTQAVPKKIPLRRANQKRTLTNCKNRLSHDRIKIRLFLANQVSMMLSHVRRSDPLLSAIAY